MRRVPTVALIGWLLMCACAAPNIACAAFSTAPLRNGSRPYAWLPMILADWGRYPSVSRYIGPTTSLSLYNVGQTDGAATPDGTDVVVVLDYGYPWKDA